MKTLEDFLDTQVDPKKIANAERSLAETHRLNVLSQRLGMWLVGSLVVLALIAGTVTYHHHQLSQGLTHRDRVEMLRLVDDINR